MLPKVAVFGSKGFLGSRFVKRLKEDGFDVFEKHSTTHIGQFNYFAPDICFHCASSNNVYEQYMIDAEVLNLAKNRPTMTLVTFGTDASYSEFGFPHSEPYYMSGEPYQAWRHYAYQKRALLNVLQTDQVVLSWYHFVITSLFGPGHRLYDTHLMHDIITKIVQYKHFHSGCGKMLTFGRNDFLREVVYVDDVVSNVLSCVMGPQYGLRGVMNCGSDSKCLPVHDLVKTACDVLEFDFYSRVQFDMEQQGHNAKWLDNSQIKKHLGDRFADTDLKTSIQQTADYVLANLL